MAAKRDDEPSGALNGEQPLDRDEKVKIDLPFEKALRAL